MSAAMVELLAKIVQQLNETAFLIVFNILDDSVNATFLSRPTLFVDGVGNTDLLVLKAGCQIDDGRLLTSRNVMQDVKAGEEQQLLVKRVSVESCDAHYLLFADIDIVGKESAIKPEHGLDDALAFAVELVEMVQGIS